VAAALHDKQPLLYGCDGCPRGCAGHGALTAQRAFLEGSGAERFRAPQKPAQNVVKVPRNSAKLAEMLAIAHLNRAGTGPERTL
jgi:hypothetical protein